MRTRPIRRCLAVLLTPALAAVAAGKPSYPDGSCTALPLPADPAAWTVAVSSGRPPAVAWGEMRAGPRVEFERPAFSTVLTLALAQPVPLACDARRVGLWLYSQARFWEGGGRRAPVRFLLRDAAGIRFSYARYGAELAPGAWGYLESPRFRGGELGRLDETMILVEGGLQHHLPVAPLSLVGIELHLSSAGYIPLKHTVELGPAYSDAVRREQSPLYWQCDLGGRYLFGDMPFAREPFVTAGDLLAEAGDYTITWHARSAMFGRPCAQGQWRRPGYDGGVTARFERLALPLTAQGQYWVTFTVERSATGGPPSGRTVETRLKIIRGSAAQWPPLNPEVRPLGALLVLNPQRAEHVYAPGELTRCTVRVWRPATNELAGLTLKVRRGLYPAGDLPGEETYPVTFSNSADCVDLPLPLDLTREAPMQQLRLTLSAGQRELERVSPWVGLQSLPEDSPWTNRDKVLRFADIFETGHHLLSCAEWDPRYAQNTDMGRFEDWVLDVKRQNVNTIELFPHWPDIEPMPGVFWWDSVDRRLAVIAKHGLRAMINLDSTSVPAWMIEESQADEEGMVNGLWHGGANNVLKSPNSAALHRDYAEYLTHLALRYRNDPTLIAYSSLLIFFDHLWADHPWQGQYVDYSESAKAGFRRYLCDVRGFALEALARRWNKPLATWEDVALPRTDLFLGLATLDRPDPRPEWRDFLDFRQWSQEHFVLGLTVGTIRKYDDLRPIGPHGLLADEARYRANAMFVCAGGSEGSLDTYRTPFEFPKRAESIAMSWYTPYYTALSTMNLLAQDNVHVQHFWQPGWRWDACGDTNRMTGTHALAGWFSLFNGDLGQAHPVHAEADREPPVLGLIFSRASILYGERSFHFPRLFDYKVLAERACPVSKVTLEEDVTAEALEKLPCVVVDPTARILPKDTIERLVAYVRGGGKLVLPPTGGMYTLDPADGGHALRKALGLPLPRSTWRMAPECRQPGVYAPYYPWDISGRGTPGEQSLSEAGQTAVATPVADGVFPPARRLVFRLGPYSMYNRDTWSDWAHMIPYFIYGRYIESRVADGTVLARWAEGGPAITTHAVGKGEVMALWGTPDWFNWREALGDVAKWAGPVRVEPSAVAAGPPPYRVSPDGFKGYILVKDAVRWAVLRNETTGWTAYYGDARKQADARRTRGVIRLADLPAAAYRVQDVTPLLSQSYDRVLSREQLAHDGIAVDLIPSEGRLFRLDPAPAGQ